MCRRAYYLGTSRGPGKAAWCWDLKYMMTHITSPRQRGWQCRCWILSLPMAHSHMLLEQALSSYYIPKKNQSLIPDYNFCLRVFSRTATSVRRRMKKSIITGCISSVLLFALTTNLIIKWTEVACRLLMSKPVRSLQLEDSWMTFYDFICAWCRWSCSGCGSSHGQDWGLSLPSLGLWYSGKEKSQITSASLRSQSRVWASLHQ